METRDVKLFEQEYDVGEKVVFSLYRKQVDDQVTMSLRYNFPDYGTGEITCKRIFFPVQAESYKSDYLSWYNLICCSNNYGPIPVVSYMNTAVQNGKKVAATIYPETPEAYMEVLNETKDNYYCFPYHVREYRYMMYISKLGTLADYFNLDEILAVYESCGTHLDAEKMKYYFSQTLNWFGNEEACPIMIHDCQGEEELATVGLLFGYPVESTIALIQKTIDMCDNEQ